MCDNINMEVKRLSNGNLLVPVRCEGEDGIIGDTVEEIPPSHPEYKEWVKYLTGSHP
jgi:hypothetical protein